MKKSIILILIILMNIEVFSKDIPKYRRSSLHVMMMEDNDLMPRYKNIIETAFTSVPFPEKYDQHDIGIAAADILSVSVPEEQSDESEAQEDKRLKGVDKKIEKYLMDQGIARSMVAKWFGRNPDGSFKTDLIAKRGSYDATNLDVRKAMSQAKSVSTQMEDAGYELIGNTFLVINKGDFIENEVAASIAYEIAKAAIAEMKADNPIQQMAKDAAQSLADKTYQKARKGYTVNTMSFLYKLTWNDSISDIFYSDYWIDESSPADEKNAKRIMFDNTDLFKMEYVGMEKAKVIVFNLTSEDLSTQQIITEATIRTTNKAYAKLQKTYDVFKPKTPLAQVENKGKLCTAKIGLKEGLEGGEKFSVLEQFTNKKGLTEYKKIGTIKVDKNKVWDNQFYASEPPVVEGEIAIQATHFKGCKKKYYPGLLIRQVK